MQMRTTVFLSITCSSLLGCAVTAPLSFVEGMPLTRPDSTLYPVRVVSIDGELVFKRPSQAIHVAPGPRWMTLEAAPGTGARRSIQKRYALKVEPCTRYVLAAKRDSPMAADWSLVVDAKEVVVGCNAEEELKKAGMVAGLETAPPEAIRAEETR